MPLVPRVDALFIHIPKTGGGSVEQGLRKFGRLQCYEWKTREHPAWSRFGHSPQHCTWRELQQLGAAEPQHRVFSVVRHPVERVVSAYNFARRLGRANNFSEFLDAFLDLSPQAISRWDAHQLPCVEFLKDDTGALASEIHLIRYSEHGLMEAVADYLFSGRPQRHKRFLSAQPAHQNTEKYMAVAELTREQRRRIEAFYAEDLQLLFAAATR